MCSVDFFHRAKQTWSTPTAVLDDSEYYLCFSKTIYHNNTACAAECGVQSVSLPTRLPMYWMCVTAVLQYWGEMSCWILARKFEQPSRLCWDAPSIALSDSLAEEEKIVLNCWNPFPILLSCIWGAGLQPQHLLYLLASVILFWWGLTRKGIWG